MPPLFANDPLLHGYWESANCVADLWPGAMTEVLETCDGGFVAVTPDREIDPAFLCDCLNSLRTALHGDRLSQVTLIFRDRGRATVRRSPRLSLAELVASSSA